MTERKAIESWLTDMDGVLVHEGVPVSGAPEFVHRMKQSGKPFLILTNNSIYTPRDLQARLSRMGIEVPEQSIWTSALATAQFLGDQRPGGTAYVIGEAGLTTALHAVGYVLTDYAPDYVVLGETRTYSFEAITKAIRLINDGARFICTNPDATGPSNEGALPAGRGADQGGHRARRRQHPLRARPARVGVGRDEPRPPADQPDGPGDRLERVGAGLAEDDVVGIGVGQRVAHLVQGGGQPCLTDDVRGAAGQLGVQEVRRRQGRGPDRFLGHVQPRPHQPRGQITRREDRVVREHQEPALAGDQPLQELGRPRQCLLLVDEHAVHVGEPALGVRPFDGHAVLRSSANVLRASSVRRKTVHSSIGTAPAAL